MRIKKFVFPLLFFGSGGLLIYRFLNWAFVNATLASPLTQDHLYEDIDAYIVEYMHRLNIPGASLAIVEGDKIVHVRGFGKARPKGESPTPQTPFFIGSLTKSFTALAVMQLVEIGKVELDAPVQHYLPWFRVADPIASSKMTVRHLLNQTSGLPMLPSEAALADFDDRPDATERQVRALSTLKLTRPVGSKFEYCNTNYNVLGLIVEAVSGDVYADYIQNHIFDPLKMKQSCASKVIAKQHGLAMGHRYWFGHPFPAPNLSIPISSLPSGQLISSAEDMAHYMIAYLNGGCYGDARILSPAGIDEMHCPIAEINEMGMSLGSYGMGWIIQGTSRNRIVWHSGIVPDFGAFMALVPEQRKGFVLLFNANHAMLKMTFDELGMNLARRLAGETLSPTRSAIAIRMMRGLMLVPVILGVSIAGTLRQLRHWRSEPETRPSLEHTWRRHILLPLIPNFLIAINLLPMMGKLRGFLQLFMPDYSWVAMVCGSLSLAWSFLRTRLTLKALHSSPSSDSS